MVFDQRAISCADAIIARWSSACARARLRRRHPLDSAHRRALERFAAPFSVSDHVLATVARLDQCRHLGTGMVPIVASPRCMRTSEDRGNVCRRHVFLGKKRGECVGKTKRGKGTKIMVHSDASGLPLSIHIASASPHEVTLIEPLLERRRLRRLPRRLIYDLAADSDPLRRRLKRRGIELICPHRSNRVQPATQDGRALRRYRRRWKIERSISWLQNFRRLVTRYEYHAKLFLGFAQLACLVIVLRRF
jgi:transposase